MCYNVASKSTTASADTKKLASKFDAEIIETDEFVTYYSVSGFSHPRLPVILSESPNHLQPVEWGLIPSWTASEEKATEIKQQTLNARSETVFEKPSFRGAIHKRRCCVIVDGFFEWQTEGKEKLPHFIYLEPREPFALGGLYDEWVNHATGEIHRGFSILTVDANPMMARIHNLKKRMPLMLKPGSERDWLNANTTESIHSFFRPFDEQHMKAHRVSKLINRRNTDTNIPEVQQPVEDFGPLTLF